MWPHEQTQGLGIVGRRYCSSLRERDGIRNSAEFVMIMIFKNELMRILVKAQAYGLFLQNHNNYSLENGKQSQFNIYSKMLMQLDTFSTIY